MFLIKKYRPCIKKYKSPTQVSFLATIFFGFLISSCAQLTQDIEIFKPYIVENNKAYWVNSSESPVHLRRRHIFSADINTIKSIDLRFYGKDFDNVYYKGIPIPKADPVSFRLLNDIYAKDSDSVFFYGIEIEGADAKTFKVIKAGIMSNFAEDNKNIYLNGERIDTCNKSSFKLPRKYYQFWSMDSMCVYHQGKKVPNLLTKNLKIINPYYASDTKNVFWQDKIIPEADPKTFKASPKGGFNHAQDKNNCYFKNTVIDCNNISKRKSFYDMSLLDAHKYGSKIAENIYKSKKNKKEKVKKSYRNTLNQLASKYKNIILHPEDVSKIDLQSLKNGYSYHLESSIDRHADSEVYVLKSVDEDIYTFDIFKRNMPGVGKQVRSSSGAILQDIKRYTSRRTTKQYSKEKCLFKLGLCRERFSLSPSSQNLIKEHNVEVDFKDGIWQYKYTLPNNKEVTYFSIYDKNGLPIYYIELIDNEVKSELKRKFTR
ncbi:DKNYY domain-containing protein [Microbulbifer sp. JMSA008]|uniref:DKNYY domain-containing protein n=1 Tax=Microbulbifer sp. JMSA008 TaxID=3243373 RepID=UPI004039A362